MFFLVFFGSGVHKTLYRTPKDPEFVKVGVVVVNHENQWENQAPRGIIWSAVPLPRFIQFLG